MEEDEWDEHPLRHADQIIHCLQKVNLKYKQSSNGTVTSAAPSCSAAQLTDLYFYDNPAKNGGVSWPSRGCMASCSG